jgi:vacuolar protein sorting-associated protein 35
MYYIFLVMATCHEQDSKAQITALHLIIGTLQRMSIFGVENRDTLTHKTTGVTHSCFVVALLNYVITQNLSIHLPFIVNGITSVFVQYSAKLLKKPDQCRAVYACSHLFWTDDQDGIMDGER